MTSEAIDITCEAHGVDEAMFYCDGHRFPGCVDTHWDQTIALRWLLDIAYDDEAPSTTVHPYDWPEERLQWLGESLACYVEASRWQGYSEAERLANWDGPEFF